MSPNVSSLPKKTYYFLLSFVIDVRRLFPMVKKVNWFPAHRIKNKLV